MVQKKQKNWITVKLDRGLVEDLDQVYHSDLSRKYGITSRQDLISRVLTAWLSNYDRQYDLFDKRKLDQTLKP